MGCFILGSSRVIENIGKGYWDEEYSRVVDFFLINASVCVASDNKTYPSEFFGVWGYSDNMACNQGYVEYMPGGLKKAVGIFCNELIAYEAEWWVADGHLHERITKVITHRDGGPILVGNQSADKILYTKDDTHALDEKGKVNTYVRLKK